ncbi:MAG: hypothetical protein ACJATA_001652 [Sphingobacteriales bacterium]|jgi:hypothetical protein
MQYYQNFNKDFTELLFPYFIFNESGYPNGIEYPLRITQKEKKRLLTHLLKNEFNRMFILKYYKNIEEKVNSIQNEIQEEIN